jgi:uncharacterized spore protein YtfJ
MTEEEQAELQEKPTGSAEVFGQTIDKYLSTAHVNAVYSRPVRQGDTVVIPAAEVVCAFGFGYGEGTGVDGESKGGGSGGGGGGRTFARPVAVIVCNENGVSVQPVMDKSKLWMAAITAAGFMLYTLGRMRRPMRR